MKEKIVVITGASSGIGKALAIEFGKLGANIVLAARNKNALVSIVADINSLGGNAICVATDVRDEYQCKNLIDKTIEKYNKIDILINNAGISMRALFEDVDLSVIHELMNTNFWGTVYCTKYALPYLISSKGSLVGVSSIAGYQGLPGRTGYSASKFAMHGFLETIRIENIKNNLHVLIACPGFTASNIRNTALNKDGKQQGESPRDESKMMSPEDVAKNIIKAIKNRKNTLILTMQGKLTVFLKKFFPSLINKLVYKHMEEEKDSPMK